MTSRLSATPRVLRCAAIAVALRVFITTPSLCRASEHSAPPPSWLQLDAALSDLDPASARARQLVPELIAAAKHSETPDALRQRSVLMLGRIGQPAEDAVPILLSLLAEYRAAEELSSESAAIAEERRVWVLKSLGLFDRVANDAVPVLRRDLLDRTRSVDDRVLIADVLGQIGTVPAVSALSDALRQWPAETPPAEQLVKRTIVDAIGLSGPVGVVGLPALLRKIEDADSSTRRQVCEAITLFGPAGELATDVLVERLVLDDDPAVRDAAADALAAIGPSSVPVLIRLLESGNPELQWRAARSLGKVGRPAHAAKSVLEQVIEVRDRSPVPDASASASQVRIEAFAAHWQITQNTSGVFRLLVEELSSDDRQVRRRASELLIAPKTLPGVLVDKLSALADGDSAAARAATYVLRRRADSDAR